MSLTPASAASCQLVGYNQPLSTISPEQLYDDLDSTLEFLRIIKETRAIALKIIRREIPAPDATVSASGILQAHTETIIRRIRTLYAPPLAKEIGTASSLLDDNPSEDLIISTMNLCKIGAFLVEDAIPIADQNECNCLIYLASEINNCILKMQSLGINTDAHGCRFLVQC